MRVIFELLDDFVFLVDERLRSWRWFVDCGIRFVSVVVAGDIGGGLFFDLHRNGGVIQRWFVRRLGGGRSICAATESIRLDREESNHAKPNK